MSALFYSMDSCDREQALETAAQALRDGKLVVFPTETVYGIGCNALDKQAVRALYAAKKRPADKPLLLHLHSLAQAETAAFIDERASRLIKTFTPGPLSVILPKRDSIPDEVTSGGKTVGLRFPQNELFQTLSARSGVLIAATSANVSGFSSAKDASALSALSEMADVILADGTCTYSFESTIVSLTDARPRILRQGACPREKIEEVIGPCD